jgi:amidase
MTNELWRMSAVEAVARLRKREISPLELVEASAQRIAEVEPAVNALPTLCLDRAREHARRIIEGGAACNAAGEAGWLAGLPVSIKDLTDVAGGAHHLWLAALRRSRAGKIAPARGAHRAQGRHRNGQVEHAGIRCGRQHLQRGLRPDAQSLEHLADLGRLDRRRRGVGRVRRGLAGAGHRPWRLVARPGQPLLCRGSAAVAGARDTRHRVQSLEPALSAGADGTQCGRPGAVSRHDGGLLPARPADFRRTGGLALARPVPPKRVAFTADYNGRMPIDREVRDICTKAARRFEELGCIVEDAAPDIGTADEAFHILRGQHFVVDRELQLRSHRDKLKPDIIWNTERGLAQTPSDIARAERERAAFYGRMAAFFGTYDLLVTPGALTPAFDVNLRNAPTIGGQKLDNYLGGSMVTAVITLTACPAMAVPCGSDQFGRPIGLQLVGKPRGEASLLQAAALFEQLLGLDQLLPVDPKPGAVPPTI